MIRNIGRSDCDPRSQCASPFVTNVGLEVERIAPF
jgi:hypothetical protein